MIKPKYYQGQSGDLIDHWYDKWGDQADIIIVANVEKYLERFHDKNGLEDIEKAQTYLSRLKEKVVKRSLTISVSDPDGSIATMLNHPFSLDREEERNG